MLCICWNVLFVMYLFGILRIPPFVNDKGKDINSDWLADQWDERSVFGHARVNKGRMKGDDPQIDTAQTPKRFDWRLALQGKIQKTFADRIPNKYSVLVAPARLLGLGLTITRCAVVSLIRGPQYPRWNSSGILLKKATRGF